MFGESYEETAMRELSEELGLAPQALHAAGLKDKCVFRWEDEWCDVWACAFSVMLTQEACSSLKLQESEVDAARFIPLTEVCQSAQPPCNAVVTIVPTSWLQLAAGTPISMNMWCVTSQVLCEPPPCKS